MLQRYMQAIENLKIRFTKVRRQKFHFPSKTRFVLTNKYKLIPYLSLASLDDSARFKPPILSRLAMIWWMAPGHRRFKLFYGNISLYFYRNKMPNQGINLCSSDTRLPADVREFRFSRAKHPRFLVKSQQRRSNVETSRIIITITTKLYNWLQTLDIKPVKHIKTVHTRGIVDMLRQVSKATSGSFVLHE